MDYINLFDFCFLFLFLFASWGSWVSEYAFAKLVLGMRYSMFFTKVMPSNVGKVGVMICLF